jgi:hypothetical protein
LQVSVKDLSDEVFSHHVDKNKNDFAVWVGEVIGDSTLSKSLLPAKTKKTFAKKVKTRLDFLKKVAGG